MKETAKNIKWYKWTAFVQLAEDHIDIDIKRMIKKVRFGVHSSYKTLKKDVYVCPNGCFQTTNIGYMFFSMPVTIYFKKETGIFKPMVVQHFISFEN